MVNTPCSIDDIINSHFSVDYTTPDSHVVMLVSVETIRKLANACCNLGYDACEKDYRDHVIEEKKDSYNEGYSDGFDEGKVEGLEKGLEEGYNNGRSEGYDEGYHEGQQDGLEAGRDAGFEEGYNAAYQELERDSKHDYP